MWIIETRGGEARISRDHRRRRARAPSLTRDTRDTDRPSRQRTELSDVRLRADSETQSAPEVSFPASTLRAENALYSTAVPSQLTVRGQSAARRQGARPRARATARAELPGTGDGGRSERSRTTFRASPFGTARNAVPQLYVTVIPSGFTYRNYAYSRELSRGESETLSLRHIARWLGSAAPATW